MSFIYQSLHFIYRLEMDSLKFSLIFPKFSLSLSLSMDDLMRQLSEQYLHFSSSELSLRACLNFGFKIKVLTPQNETYTFEESLIFPINYYNSIVYFLKCKFHFYEAEYLGSRHIFYKKSMQTHEILTMMNNQNVYQRRTQQNT